MPTNGREVLVSQVYPIKRGKLVSRDFLQFILKFGNRHKRDPAVKFEHASCFRWLLRLEQPRSVSFPGI